MYIIGTAGHVDHGKSTLVQALTGINPDRLKEEQERQMTIDLGFAWMKLPDEKDVGLIDVPGHRDFINNMLAGVGGIDLVLLVVAADEGVMPQTREHLSIINLLKIQTGIIVITKTDLVEDADWLALIKEDISISIAGTVLESAPMICVSTVKRKGLEELTKAISDQLANISQRQDYHRPRLSVDRVFSMSGFGTVVTGTLLDGCLSVGDEIIIFSEDEKTKSGRIRGLQVHKHSVLKAKPGSRTAVNIVGIHKDDISRGDVLTLEGAYVSTQRIDVVFDLLKDYDQPLKHNTQVRFFLGAKELSARIRIIGAEALQPGEQGWLQLEFQSGIIAYRGDRFILRTPSPPKTLGGGMILDAHAKNRYKRFDPEIIERFKLLDHGNPVDLLYDICKANSPEMRSRLLALVDWEPEKFDRALCELASLGKIRNFSATNKMGEVEWIVSDQNYHQLLKKTETYLYDYHLKFPMSLGIQKKRLFNHLNIVVNLTDQLIKDWVAVGKISQTGLFFSLPDHHVQLSQRQKQDINNLLEKFDKNPFNPPGVDDCEHEVGAALVNYLIEHDELIPVAKNIVFQKGYYQKLYQWVLNRISTNGQLKATELRDHFQTSRKYALAFLEHLDQIGATVREGDYRVLRNNGELTDS
jgi:selenocysteine-specific elongation factor